MAADKTAAKAAADKAEAERYALRVAADQVLAQTASDEAEIEKYTAKATADGAAAKEIRAKTAADSVAAQILEEEKVEADKAAAKAVADKADAQRHAAMAAADKAAAQTVANQAEAKKYTANVLAEKALARAAADEAEAERAAAKAAADKIAAKTAAEKAEADKFAAGVAAEEIAAATAAKTASVRAEIEKIRTSIAADNAETKKYAAKAAAAAAAAKDIIAKVAADQVAVQKLGEQKAEADKIAAKAAADKAKAERNAAKAAVDMVAAKAAADKAEAEKYAVKLAADEAAANAAAAKAEAKSIAAKAAAVDTAAKQIFAKAVDAFSPVSGAECTGNPEALGTSRVLAISPQQFSHIGRIQYSQTLPLDDHEVVLTFDDGPIPPYTDVILDILKSHCVRATHFLIGEAAQRYPAAVRRIYNAGQTVGVHSLTHPAAFQRLSAARVQQEVKGAIGAIDGAIGDANAVAPFFRIPGLGRSDAIDSFLNSQSLVTWSADVVADDWFHHITPTQIVERAIRRLDAKGRGILLLHEIQPATALALPMLLKELKKRGYQVVHVVPARELPKSVPDLPGPTVAMKSGWPRTIVATTPRTEEGKGPFASEQTRNGTNADPVATTIPVPPF